MSDRTDERRASGLDRLNGAPELFVLAVLAALLVFWAGMIAISALVYPAAWLLGFRPRRWWEKSDGLHWSRFVLVAASVTFFAALSLSLAIVFLTNYH